MITRPTTLVLGAGASVPYGFPTGEGLAERIREIARERGSKEYTQLLSLSVAPREISKFVAALDGITLNSVDLTLQYRPEFSRVGKLMIAIAILEKEVYGPLQYRAGQNGAWYPLLLGALHAPREMMDGNKLNVITFNYDRSLEVYLQTAFSHLYNIDQTAAGEIVKRIPILHMHGVVGALPWENPNEFIKYEAWTQEPNEQLLDHAARRIRVIHEEDETVAENETLARARSMLLSSREVIFVGMAYHRMNIERLNLDEVKGQNRRLTLRGTGCALPIAHRVAAREQWGIEIDERKENRAYEYFRDVYSLLTPQEEGQG